MDARAAARPVPGFETRRSQSRIASPAKSIRDKSDCEEHHLRLTQLLEYLKEDYKKIESKVGLPLEKIL